MSVEPVVVERSIRLPAGLEDAWGAILDFGSWFCDEALVAEVRPGARGEFRWADGSSRAAVFEDVEAPAFLAFRWLPFERAVSGVPVPRPQTRVEIRLEATPDDVQVAIRERRLDEALSEASA
jgi:uncharacterized protein YndB with AHSA1/START domain